MPSQKLREAIRTGEIQCDCWNRGIRPGFRIVGGDTRYAGKEETGHFTTCPWVKAVNDVYLLERK